MMPENSPRTPGSPIALVTWPNAKAVIIAPHFPQAAESPWAVPRTRVGKTSEGSRNVVQLGPMQMTNWDSAKMAISPAGDVCAVGTDRPAQMAYKRHTAADVYSW